MVVTSRCLAFRALIKHEFEKGFELKNSSSLLYSPIYLSSETWKIFRNTECQFYSLELTFKTRKTRILESIFSAKQGLITRTSFVYRTSRLVRISLLISALNKRVLFFSLESYFTKAIENSISCVCI